MANPYMRDALMDEMEQGVNTTKPVEKQVAPYPWDKKAIDSQYQTSTGRLPGEEDYATHVGNPGGQQGVLDAITGSQEAKDYSAAQAAAPPPAQTASAGPLGASGATAGKYSGFDTQRAQDPSKSAKDAFLQSATASGSMPSTKADAEAWFNQYIKGDLEAKGYKVYSVTGDKAIVGTTENPGGEEIDFLIGADGDNPQLGWQSNMAGQTTGGASTSPGSAGANQAQLNGALSDPAVLEKINAQIDTLMKQGMTMEQIMALFTPQQGTGA